MICIENLFRLLRMMADNPLVDKHDIDIDIDALKGEKDYHYEYKPEYTVGFTLTEDGKMLTTSHPSVCNLCTTSHLHCNIEYCFQSYHSHMHM